MSSLKLSEIQLRAIAKSMAQAFEGPVYQYPWVSLERELKRRGLSCLPLIAYGSLINIKSATYTLSDQSCHRSQPVISFGARRLFNYKLPEENRYGQIEGRYQAALNVKITNNIDDVVNGKLFKIKLHDIPACRKRENGYDLVPITTINWNDIEAPPFLAYILRCPDDPIDEKQLIDNHIVPHSHYYLTCRTGALHISVDFLRFWLDTTYMADGITPVTHWKGGEFPDLKRPRNRWPHLD